MVVHRRMDRRAVVPRFGCCRSPPAGQIRRLFLDRTRHVGERRYGRRIAPADFSDLWDEWRRTSRGPRRPASPTPASPGRLQEREIPYPSDGYRQSEGHRQGSGRGLSRRRLRLVRRHLTGGSRAHRVKAARALTVPPVSVPIACKCGLAVSCLLGSQITNLEDSLQEDSCQHPAAGRRFAGAVPAKKKLSSCASAWQPPKPTPTKPASPPSCTSLLF